MAPMQVLVRGIYLTYCYYHSYEARFTPITPHTPKYPERIPLT